MRNHFVAAVSALSAVTGGALAPAPIAKTPPMGWMSWEIFRCEVDCATFPDSCINEALYKAQTDALVNGGYLQAGYNSIHIDDCWPRTSPPRDPTTHQLVPDPSRFPSGFKALGDYMHAAGVKFAAYTAESTSTCGGYPGSQGYEELDAATFASWGVDYMKVDGCNSNGTYYEVGYPLMGAALQNVGRSIVYSCSWPAYLGTNETQKPYQAFIDSGCNLWRNWDDIQCNWQSLQSIIDHWGDYTPTLQQWAAPNHWNDADMLLVGNDCINDDEARTQMAIWSIIASPLIMGNDLRNVSASARAILLNADAIAVNQDPAGKQGGRITDKNATEVWARNLADGSVAVALLNKAAATSPNATCPRWNVTSNGYLEACGGSGGDIYCFSGRGVGDLQTECCQNLECAGFSFEPSDGSGCFKYNTNCGFVPAQGYQGYYKPTFNPSNYSAPADITVQFSQVGLNGNVKVYDIWAQADLGTFAGSFTAKQVPFHGNSFLRLTAA